MMNTTSSMTALKNWSEGVCISQEEAMVRVKTREGYEDRAGHDDGEYMWE